MYKKYLFDFSILRNYDITQIDRLILSQLETIWDICLRYRDDTTIAIVENIFTYLPYSANKFNTEILCRVVSNIVDRVFPQITDNLYDTQALVYKPITNTLEVTIGIEML